MEEKKFSLVGVIGSGVMGHGIDSTPVITEKNFDASFKFLDNVISRL